jgi:tetratricopeptide (TPR) repeat protein
MDALLDHLEGPEGARIALAAVRAALDLELRTIAQRALDRALECDPDVEEFSTLNARARELGRDREGATRLLERIMAMSQNKYANAGRALLELGANVARELGDMASAARLMVLAAERDPDDVDLARRAFLAAQLLGDSSLLDRIASALPTADRVVNLMEMAMEAERGADLPLAIDALERIAADTRATDQDRTRARLRLRELYAMTGRHDDLERLLSAEIERGELEGAALSRAARDLAALFSARGKSEQAVACLEKVARSLPGDAPLLEDLAAHAGRAGDTRRRVAALSALVDLISVRDRPRVLRELAPLLEEIGDDLGSTARWQELSELEPDDPHALAALEHAAEKRGDFERAAALLARRATNTQSVDEARRLRLRRATILEQRLGRADEARAELEALLAATGDHSSVLRELADLHGRLGAPLRAAPLWLRASALTQDRDEAAELGRRACEAYVAGGDVDAARRVLDGMEAWARSTRMLELRVDIERRSGDARALASALEELAAEVAGDRARHVALLVEAARAHDFAGDHQDALAAAERAAELAPAAAEPQLMARWLEYRVRGPTTREHARFVVAALRGIEGDLTAAQAELRTFLIAEALDSAVGTGAGMRELTKLYTDEPLPPLVALGIAERLVEGGEHSRALPLFDVALSGELHDVRQRGRVAIMAADAAREAGDLERALGYVQIAASDAVTRDAGLALQSQLRAEKLAAEMARQRRQPAAPPIEASPETLPGPRDASPPPPEELPEPTRRSRAAPARAPSGMPPPRPLSSPPRGDTTYRSQAPPADVLRAPSARPAMPASAPVSVSSKPASSKPPAGPQGIEMPPSLRRISGAFAAASGAEAELIERLAMGSVEAGLELMKQLENRRSRSHDLVAVCRRLVQIMPGDRDLLRRLYEAALADKNHVYARAIEHVLALFDPSIEAVTPPPLGDQPEDPERVRSLLFRDTLGSAAEALALVWDGASHLFRREPAAYGVTGVERVPVNAPSPLARAYAGAARVLGLGRTPLFQRRTAGPITIGVALLTPPALIVSGEVVRDSPDLRYHVGAMLTATLPEHVLLFGSGEEQARTLFKGILLAFGPPEEHKEALASAGNLAEALWERIPARSQRRLRELCHDAGGIDYDTALDAARRAVRRAGLFVSGDLAVALRETCRQEQIPLEQLATPLALTGLCRHTPAVADLVRLATGSEYASVRWQPGRTHRPGAAG